ncbi:MAG TPA: hypothetical protein VK479_07435 [Micropepsaceae bacterium]|nr:hypothetical protein [Micropepsaceae bacterium]
MTDGHGAPSPREASWRQDASFSLRWQIGTALADLLEKRIIV